MDLKKIYKKALDITLRHKPLWAIGITVSVFAGGGCNALQNLDIGTDPSDFSNFPKRIDQEGLNNLLKFISELFKGIPIWVWFALVISFLSALVVGFIFNLIVRNWALGSLVGGINDAYDEKDVTLGTVSRHGLRSLRSLIWLNIVPWLLYFLVLLIPGLIILFSFIIFVPLGILSLFFFGFFAIISFLAIAAIQIWATRVAVIENKSGKEAFAEGLVLIKKHFLDTLVLGCLNTCLGCLSGCTFGCLVVTIALPLITSGAAFYFLARNKILIVPILGMMLLMAGIFFILINSLFNGIYTVFNYSTWNILYRRVREGTNEQ